MIGNAEFVEILWTAIAIVGVLLALDSLDLARFDRDAVRNHRKTIDARRYALECAIVSGDVVSAWWILLQELAQLAVGILAMTQPAPEGGRSPFGWTVVALLMVAAAALPLRLYDQRRRRRRLGLSDDRRRA